MVTTFGTKASETLTGSTGHDYLFGGGGNDTLYGLDGNDYLAGDDGNDVIFGGSGRDTIYGGYGDDAIVVDDVFDYYSSAGDQINGEGGNNTLYAQSKNSGSSLLLIKLGKVENVQTLYNLDSTKELTVEGSGLIDVSGFTVYRSEGGKLGQIWGSSANDTIKGFDFAGHKDSIAGGAGHDVISGMAGDDNLIADSGNDQLIGGFGNDHLIGGAGSDTFEFAHDKSEGSDRIADFTKGSDLIKIAGTGGAYGFADMVFTDVTDGCQVTLASGTVIALAGVASSALSAGDFVFV